LFVHKAQGKATRLPTASCRQRNTCV